MTARRREEAAPEYSDHSNEFEERDEIKEVRYEMAWKEHCVSPLVGTTVP